jgi:acetyl esterase
MARALVRLPESLQVLLSGKRRVMVDGQQLDPSLQLLLAVRPAHDGLIDAGPVESRARFQREIVAVRGRSTPIGSVQDLTIQGAAGPLTARHYIPEGKSGEPLAVYFHGGGFVLGGLETHDEPCRLLAKHAGCQVLSVAYRLAPEHPFPAAVEDAVAAFRWAVAHASGLGADPARVAVAGDSAGATLAAVVCQLTAREAARPAAQLLVYPPTDHGTPRASHQMFDLGYLLTMVDREAFYALYLGETGADPNQPRISPLRAPSLAGLPPALVVIAGYDILRDEGRAYAEALRAAGTPCQVQEEPSLAHGFINLTGTCPAAHRAVVAMAERWR